MKSWYDLNNEKRKDLKEEFYKNNKKYSYLKTLLYVFSIIFGFIFAILYYMKSNSICSQNSFCYLHTNKFGIAFLITFIIAIITSIINDYLNNKKFESWLEFSKNIKK